MIIVTMKMIIIKYKFEKYIKLKPNNKKNIK